MSSALFFLGIAFVIAVIGGAVVMVMHRTPASQSGDGVDQFRRFMDALAPDEDGGPAPDDVPAPDDTPEPQRSTGEG